MLTPGRGALPQARPGFDRAQLGTLGAGNHYAEVQVVDEIYDWRAANKMGIERTGQVCIMIHSGSRGLGHQVATGTMARRGARRPPCAAARALCPAHGRS